MIIKKIAITFATLAMTVGICGSSTKVTEITLYSPYKDEYSRTPGVPTSRQKITFTNFADIFQSFKGYAESGKIVGIFTLESPTEYQNIKKKIIEAMSLDESKFQQLQIISPELDKIFADLTDHVRAVLPNTHNIEPVPTGSTWGIDNNLRVCVLAMYTHSDTHSGKGEWNLVLNQGNIVLWVPITQK